MQRGYYRAGKKVVMERELHSAFLRFSQPLSSRPSVSSAGVGPAPLLSVPPIINSSSVVPPILSSSTLAMDAAVAAREAAQLVYFNANFRLFKFIFLIQEGYSQRDRIERFNTNLGVDSRGSILKLEEVRQAMAPLLYYEILYYETVCCL